MKTDDFKLQHSDIPQSKLPNEDPVTTKWPMPPVWKYEPRPQNLTMVERLRFDAARKLGL